MTEINHRVGIKATAQQVYQALTSDTGLSCWWTEDTSGAGVAGSIIQFRFDGGGPDFAVIELIPDELVRWQHSGCVPEAWMGTEIRFQIQPEDEQTFVRFTHANWQQTSDFMAHCSTKWAVFLLSLKQYLETGRGQPFPHDTHIDHSE
jgi:uncharacterized protein YndB with AHSA1/START domain